MLPLTTRLVLHAAFFMVNLITQVILSSWENAQRTFKHLKKTRIEHGPDNHLLHHLFCMLLCNMKQSSGFAWRACCTEQLQSSLAMAVQRAC